MRIISKFSDYYDAVAGYDTDPKRVYVRKTREFYKEFGLFFGKQQEKSLFLDLRNILVNIPNLNNAVTGVVAFCGKAYPYYCIYTYAPDDIESYHVAANVRSYCYSWQAVVRCYEQDIQIMDKALGYVTGREKARLISRRSGVRTDLKDIKSKHGATSTNIRDFPFSDSGLTERHWDRFISDTDLMVPDAVFRDVEAPVIHVTHGDRHQDMCVEVNPVLKNLGFASAVDPYTAYQTVEMFMGTNMATQMDPNVHVSDEIKAESHGFDKHSFRSAPTRKTKRRKMRK